MESLSIILTAAIAWVFIFLGDFIVKEYSDNPGRYKTDDSLKDHLLAFAYIFIWIPASLLFAAWFVGL